jgi:hypothetical protein
MAATLHQADPCFLTKVRCECDETMKGARALALIYLSVGTLLPASVQERFPSVTGAERSTLDYSCTRALERRSHPSACA